MGMEMGMEVEMEDARDCLDGDGGGDILALMHVSPIEMHMRKEHGEKYSPI